MRERKINGIFVPEDAKTVKSFSDLITAKTEKVLAKLPINKCEFDSETLTWKAPNGFVFKVTGNFRVVALNDLTMGELPSKRFAINNDDCWDWDIEDLPTSFEGKFLSLSEVGQQFLYIKQQIETEVKQGALRQVIVSLNGEEKEYLYEDKAAVMIDIIERCAMVDLNMSLRRFRISVVENGQFDKEIENKSTKKYIESFVVVPLASRPPEKPASGGVTF